MWPNDGPVERSHHEAGHAVARAILGIPFAEVVCDPPQYIIISGPPHPQFVDTNFSAPDTLAEARKLSWHPEAEAFVRKLIISCAAGPVAQMQFERQAAPGDASRFYLFGGSNDAGWLEGHALVLACHHTTSDSEALDLKCKLVKFAVAEATVLVRDYQTVIESVAGELLGRRRLSEAEVKALIDS